MPIDPADAGRGTVDLGVTARRAKPDSWNSPVLVIADSHSRYSRAIAGAPTKLGDHDIIWIDQRGSGRSAAYKPCDEAGTFVAKLNSIDIDAKLGTLLRECVNSVRNASLPLDTVVNQDFTAEDFDLVRQALGVKKWSIYTGNLGADIALRMVNHHPETVTALVALAPSVAGTSLTPASAEAAFRLFAADCAAIPKCAATGDLNAVLDAEIKRFTPGIVTKTPDPISGGFVRLDAPSLLYATGVAMSDASLAPLLPGLMAGLADGTADELVAGFFANRPGDLADPLNSVLECQQLALNRPATSVHGDLTCLTNPTVNALAG